MHYSVTPKELKKWLKKVNIVYICVSGKHPLHVRTSKAALLEAIRNYDETYVCTIFIDSKINYLKLCFLGFRDYSPWVY